MENLVVLQKYNAKKTLKKFGTKATELMKKNVILKNVLEFYKNNVNKSKKLINEFTKMKKNKLKLKENILINIKQINKNLNEFNIKNQNENIKLSKKISELKLNLSSLIFDNSNSNILQKIKEDNFLLENSLNERENYISNLIEEKSNINEEFSKIYVNEFNYDFVEKILKFYLRLYQQKLMELSKKTNKESNKISSLKNSRFNLSVEIDVRKSNGNLPDIDKIYKNIYGKDLKLEKNNFYQNFNEQRNKNYFSFYDINDIISFDNAKTNNNNNNNNNNNKIYFGPNSIYMTRYRKSIKPLFLQHLDSGLNENFNNENFNKNFNKNFNNENFHQKFNSNYLNLNYSENNTNNSNVFSQNNSNFSNINVINFNRKFNIHNEYIYLDEDDIFFSEFEEVDLENNDVKNKKEINFLDDPFLLKRSSIKAKTKIDIVPKINLNQINFNKIKINIETSRRENKKNKKKNKIFNIINEKIKNYKEKNKEIKKKIKTYQNIIKKFDKFYVENKAIIDNYEEYINSIINNNLDIKDEKIINI